MVFIGVVYWRALVRGFLILTIVFWVALIFYFSSQSPEASSRHVNVVLRVLRDINRALNLRDSRFFQTLERFIFKTWFRGQSVNAEELLRSTAHFGLYMVFGFTTCTSFWFLKKDLLSAFLLGVSLPAVVAILDEYNQMFRSRQATVIDAFVDLEGAFVGSLLALIAILLLRTFINGRSRPMRGLRNAKARR